jgi:hypothetical protein
MRSRSARTSKVRSRPLGTVDDVSGAATHTARDVLPPALTSASGRLIPVRFARLATSAKRRSAVDGFGLEPANRNHSG